MAQSSSVHVEPRLSSSLHRVRIAVANGPVADSGGGDITSSRLGRTIVHHLIRTLDDGKIIHDGPLRGAAGGYAFEFEFSAAALPGEREDEPHEAVQSRRLT